MIRVQFAETLLSFCKHCPILNRMPCRPTEHSADYFLREATLTNTLLSIFAHFRWITGLIIPTHMHCSSSSRMIVAIVARRIPSFPRSRVWVTAVLSSSDSFWVTNQPTQRERTKQSGRKENFASGAIPVALRSSIPTTICYSLFWQLRNNATTWRLQTIFS